MTLEEKIKENEEIQKAIKDWIDANLYTRVSAPISPKELHEYYEKHKPKPKQSIDDLLDQGYSLRQIQQIMKGEN